MQRLWLGDSSQRARAGEGGGGGEDFFKLPRRVINPAAGYYCPLRKENRGFRCPGKNRTSSSPAAGGHATSVADELPGGLGCAKPEERELRVNGATGRGAGKTEDGVWKVTSCDWRLTDATVAGVASAGAVPVQMEAVEYTVRTSVTDGLVLKADQLGDVVKA